MSALDIQPIGAAEAKDDRERVIDALYRFGAGQDFNDAALFASAFTEDAVVDFTQPAQQLGVTLPRFRGKAAIVPSIMAAVAALDTTHTVTNPRVAISGDQARLVALVEAQHLPKNDHGRHLLLKNWYDVAPTTALGGCGTSVSSMSGSTAMRASCSRIAWDASRLVCVHRIWPLFPIDPENEAPRTARCVRLAKR